MKGIKLLFCVCLGTLAFWRAFALDGDDTVRAATRRPVSSTTTTTTNQRTITTATPQKTAVTTRATSNRERTGATESRGGTQTPTVVQRTVSSRTKPATTRPTVQNRPPQSRQATTNISRATTSRAAGTSRNAAQKQRIKTKTARATTDESGALVTTYTKCRTVFYDCMDEFCANKDANLRRCACSARANEFDGMKQQMTNVENKMLDFNQRLLMVNMDAEDVTAINTATEGEDAFYSTRDTTKSKRALDDIAKKLNAKFGGDSDYSGGLGAVSLTLNVDAAFDTVDSFMGIDTTTKSGVALYNAAIPVCHDIAAEVCTEDELSLAQSGYQMQIEQDCNTVKKSYQAQADQARAKVFESGALLDMSRLDTYQTRNSDDILTCKRKMLEMLTDTTVCGSKMEKCLDMTGRYIDPTTGAAFLSVNLADLDTMITRPGINQTWTSANSSGKFITFLQDRKQYLKTAMEHCEDIADTVWDAFVEDALAQIKLAQTAKLEEIRQACTKLTTECLDTANDSIEDFDARALSIFGVLADKTVNTMCADVRESCANLLGATGDSSWGTGVHEISTNMTYDSIISSCTQVGQNCIIQTCKTMASNFGLCDDIYLSPNRHSILERTACWPDVLNCVAAAGDDAIMSIMQVLGHSDTPNRRYAFYNELYGDADIDPLYDICGTKCNDSADNYSPAACATCRIAERIWGNCEYQPSELVNEQNKILIPQSNQSTLLSWFGINTGTIQIDTNGTYISGPNSCTNTRCSTNNHAMSSTGTDICLTDDQVNDRTTEGLYCPVGSNNNNITISISGDITNCCFGETGNILGTIPIPDNNNNLCCEGSLTSIEANHQVCLPESNVLQKAVMKNDNKYLVCIGDDDITGETTQNITGYPNGNEIHCDGRFVLIDSNAQTYTNPTSTDVTSEYSVSVVYYPRNDPYHQIPQTITNSTSGFIHYNLPQ